MTKAVAPARIDVALKNGSDTLRSRVRSLRHVRASELRANPKNWRQHPASQRSALMAVLAEIGFADVVLVRETAEGLELIDGHLRADIAGDTKIPVVVLDLDEREADLLLATLDPLAGMADTDGAALEALLASVALDTDDLLRRLIEQTAGIVDDPNIHWVGMPEFEQEDMTAWKTLLVHFSGQSDLEAFAALVGQVVTLQTKSIWYPPAEIDHYITKRYVSDES